MSRIGPELIGPGRAAAAVAAASGPTWVPVVLAGFSESSDPSAILSGAIVDHGGGLIEWPLKAADEQFMDLKVAANNTKTLAELATFLGAVEADIVSGVTVIMTQIEIAEIKGKVQIFAGLVDSGAATPGAIDGLAGGVLSDNGSTVKCAYVNGSTKGNDGTAVAFATAFSVSRVQQAEIGGVNQVSLVTELFYLDDNNTPYRVGLQEQVLTSGLGPISHYTMGVMFTNNSGGSVGSTRATIHVAAVAAADLYYQTVP